MKFHEISWKLSEIHEIQYSLIGIFMKFMKLPGIPPRFLEIFHEFHEISWISWISPNMSQMVGFLTKRTVFPSTRPVCNVISVFPRFVINFMFWYQVVPQKPVISWSGKSTGQHISESMSYIYILKVDFMILVIYSILVFKWNHPRLSFCSWGTQWESQNGVLTFKSQAVGWLTIYRICSRSCIYRTTYTNLFYTGSYEKTW